MSLLDDFTAAELQEMGLEHEVVAEAPVDPIHPADLEGFEGGAYLQSLGIYHLDYNRTFDAEHEALLGLD